MGRKRVVKFINRPVPPLGETPEPIASDPSALCREARRLGANDPDVKDLQVAIQERRQIALDALADIPPAGGAIH